MNKYNNDGFCVSVRVGASYRHKWRDVLLACRGMRIEWQRSKVSHDALQCTRPVIQNSDINSLWTKDDFHKRFTNVLLLVVDLRLHSKTSCSIYLAIWDRGRLFSCLRQCTAMCSQSKNRTTSTTGPSSRKSRCMRATQRCYIYYL